MQSTPSRGSVPLTTPNHQQFFLEYVLVGGVLLNPPPSPYRCTALSLDCISFLKWCCSLSPTFLAIERAISLLNVEYLEPLS